MKTLLLALTITLLAAPCYAAQFTLTVPDDKVEALLDACERVGGGRFDSDGNEVYTRAQQGKRILVDYLKAIYNMHIDLLAKEAAQDASQIEKDSMNIT